MALLQRIQSPSDLKALPQHQLPVLAEEIRQRIIEVTARNGGHIGPNLGVVELTIALHRVFSTPEDKFVFDVAHQGYVHKLLTGRNGPEFNRIRQSDGLCGFLTRSESEHDAYGAGHAGTALSAALGMAVGRDRKGQSHHVVAVLGDAALTCGITLEALNNISASTDRLIVILNDNEWSIAKNVGAIAGYLNSIITDPLYNRFDHEVRSLLERLPGGQSFIDLARRWKKETKDFLVPSGLFETFGMRYIGPVDGHDLVGLERYLQFARATSDTPILLHVLTQKGKGYETALLHPERFHGSGPFDIATGEGRKPSPGTPPLYQDVLGQALTRQAARNPSICGITAAMPSGTGLNILRDTIPSQFHDVGIAEEHAVLFAAGMATEGLRPVVAIYSTFLQRAFDPIVHDVCLQNLPVVFCLDRAGLSPNDGPTHHGLFDLAYLRCVPNAVVMQPANEDELCDMLHTSLALEQPCFIRYPRGNGVGVPIKEEPTYIPLGRAEVLRPGTDLAIWALGPWIADAHALAERLLTENGVSAAVVNARFVKPLDLDLLATHGRSMKLIVTMEDHVVAGGFGSAVLEALEESGVSAAVERIGWPDSFIEHGSSVTDLRSRAGLDPASIHLRILQRFRSLCPEAEDALMG